MKTVFIVDCLEVHSDWCNYQGDDISCPGHRLPGFVFCDVCGEEPVHDHRFHYHFDLPMECPTAILEESQNLSSIYRWEGLPPYPRFDPDILLPYLQKWTDLLRSMGHDIPHTIRPSTTFGPDLLYSIDDFMESDLIKVMGIGWLTSEALMEELEVCGGISFREVVPRYQKKYFHLLFDYPFCVHFKEVLLLEEAQKGHTTHCFKCNRMTLTKGAEVLLGIKTRHFCKNRIFPAHFMPSEEIDIFPHFAGMVISEKALSIIKRFHVPGLRVTKYDVVDSEQWFDDDYWKSRVRKRKKRRNS